MAPKQSNSLGKISVYCALASVVFLGIFLLSGFILPYIAEEQAIVITQLLSVILTPLTALIGLILGIVGATMGGAQKKMASSGAWLNGFLLALQCIGLSFLVIASSTTTIG